MQFCEEMNRTKGITRIEIAGVMGVDYTTLTTYYNKPEFSSVILTKRIAPLVEAYGINAAYFEDESEKNLFKNALQNTSEDEQTEILNLILENTSEVMRLVENSNRLMERIQMLEKLIEEKDLTISRLSQALASK